ncbi:SAM-dependent methyltransferase [Candidatus Peribacteria bacterium]|nr:SAM-dependent methyltransferase [Candidatus Peribacteria bacterium]
MQSAYALLDFGQGRRLEQWGPYRLIRPDPTTLGAAAKTPDLWGSADATYEGEKGKGEWKMKKSLPEQWTVEFADLQLSVQLAPYKHTGVFPEQEQNWMWARTQAKKSEKPLTVLNLFAYTGGMSIALAKDGHFVTHVDASKPAITWARENAELNAIPKTGIRWMLEDAALFVTRERKRGKRYGAIVLDPPAFGHSPSGKTWRVERDLAPLLENCCALLSDSPAFLVLNGYAHGDTPESFHRLLTGVLKKQRPELSFDIDTRELDLVATDGRKLSTGTVARCGFRK